MIGLPLDSLIKAAVGIFKKFSTDQRNALLIQAQLLDHIAEDCLELRDNLGATIVVVTHELASIFTIANNSVFLDAESRTQIATGDPHDMLANSHDPRVRRFLTRGQEGGDSAGSNG